MVVEFAFHERELDVVVPAALALEDFFAQRADVGRDVQAFELRVVGHALEERNAEACALARLWR